MNDWQANRTAALDILASLNPDAYKARYSELLRGGLSASSIPEGSRSSEKPLPGFDRFDTTLQWEQRNYDQTWAELVKLCRQLESHENALLLVMGVRLPEFQPDPKAWGKAMEQAQKKATKEMDPNELGERFNCENCHHIFKRTKTQRKKSGRCKACYAYWAASRFTKDAPQPLIDRRVEREIERAL